MKKSFILFVFLSLILSQGLWSKAKNVQSTLVIPIKTNLKGDEDKITQKGLTQLLLTQLVLSDIKTTSYERSKDIFKILKEKKLVLKDLEYTQIVANLDFIIMGTFEKYNQTSTFILQIVDAKSGRIIFEDQDKLFVPKMKWDNSFFKEEYFKKDNLPKQIKIKYFENEILNKISRKNAAYKNFLLSVYSKVHNVPDGNNPDSYMIRSYLTSLEKRKIAAILKSVRYTYLTLNNPQVLNYFNHKQKGHQLHNLALGEKVIVFLKMIRLLEILNDEPLKIKQKEEANFLLKQIRNGKFDLQIHNDVISLFTKLKLEKGISELAIKKINSLEIKLGTNKKKQIEIMIVTDSTRSMKDELSSLRKNIRKIVESLHSKRQDLDIRISITDYKNVYDSYRAKTLPFTSDISQIEKHLDELVKTKRDGARNDIQFGLYHGLNHGNWSIYEADAKIIFLLTDRPIDEKVQLNADYKVMLLPFKNLALEKNALGGQTAFHLLLTYLKLNKSQIDLSHGAHRYIEESRVNTSQLQELSSIAERKFQIEYTIKCNIMEMQNGITLKAKIVDNRNNRVVFVAKQKLGSQKQIYVAIKGIGEKILYFFKRKSLLNSRMVNSGEYTVYDPSFAKIIDLAKSLKVHVYTIGCSGIDRKSEVVLKRYSRKMNGDYISAQYSYPAFLSNHDRVQFVYKNQELYEEVESNTLTAVKINNKKQNILKNISLGKKITTVEQTKAFLLAEGYPIDKSFGFHTTPIRNDISVTISDILENYIGKKRDFDQIIAQCGNYFIPINVKKLKKYEIKRLNSWIENETEVVLAVRVLPTSPYKVLFKENNRFIHKVLNYQFHPIKIKIFPPSLSQFVPDFLQTTVGKMNKTPYFYGKKGFGRKKYWFVKAKIIKLIAR